MSRSKLPRKVLETMAEIEIKIDQMIMNECMAAKNMEKLARIDGRQQVIDKHLGGNELHFQIEMNMLERFEALNKSGKTLQESIDTMRKEGWHDKIIEIISARIDRQTLNQ